MVENITTVSANSNPKDDQYIFLTFSIQNDPDHSAISLFRESLNLSHAFLNFGTSMGDGKSFTFQAYKWPTCHVELAGDTYNILK